MSGVVSQVAVGVADLLATAGVGYWSPDGTGSNTAGLPVILIAREPDSPDAVLCLTVRRTSDDPTYADSTVEVQVISRTDASANVLAVDDLAEAVFDVLHGYAGSLSTGVPVITSARVGGGPLGTDGQERRRRSDNYSLRILAPGRNRK